MNVYRIVRILFLNIGEWILEAGALVLAYGGICCIDEFNMMSESDRTAMHEGMEQQTVSLAKAGIVCKLNTKCAIIAAANPKNVNSKKPINNFASITNIGISSPLLSRFDLVFVLSDQRILEWDDAIADHLLAQVTTGYTGVPTDSRDNELWDQQKLQSHFNVISQIRPKMTTFASQLLSEYYKKCRLEPERDWGRTSIRLLDSLNRLAEAHARLLFRSEIVVEDAIVAIRLVESSFGFGRIMKSYDVIKEELPLGPNSDEISCALEILGLSLETKVGKSPSQFNIEEILDEDFGKGDVTEEDLICSSALDDVNVVSSSTCTKTEGSEISRNGAFCLMGSNDNTGVSSSLPDVGKRNASGIEHSQPPMKRRFQFKLRPTVFSPSGRLTMRNISDEDLSCLDSTEI